MPKHRNARGLGCLLMFVFLTAAGGVASPSAVAAADPTLVASFGFDETSGTSSADLPCRALVRLTGDVRGVGHDRTLTTPVDLTPVVDEGAGGG